jgi:glucose/mannose-6-phosphate isomerase
MRQLVSNFSNQLREALSIGQSADLKPSNTKFNNVLITGIGGSGIGGTIISELIAQHVNIPIVVNKDYSIPNFVDENTLVITSSFSGNTEETLSAFELAQTKGAEIACISSGGKLLDVAKEKSFNYIQLPMGKSPRAMLSYSITQFFVLFEHYGLIDNYYVDDIQKTIALVDSEEENIIAEADTIATLIQDKMPIIYATQEYEGMAIRFRQQINENAKMLCWHQAIPEMNHNELVGWTEKNETLAVLFFRNDTDFGKNQKRIEISKTVIAKYTPHIKEVWSKGDSIIQRTLYFIHLCDWVSVLLSDKRSVDPIEVRVIDYLKSELAK